MGENPSNFYNNLIKYANPPAGGCNWDYDYYRTNYINAIMLAQLKQGNYIKEGLIPSIGAGLNIDFTEGTAVINGTEFFIAAGSAVTAAAPLDGVEFNSIYVNGAGSVVVIQEDPAVDFAAIAIVDTDDTTILRLMDARQTGSVQKLVDWESVRSADFNVSTGIGYPVNTSSVAITATLPAAPEENDSFTIKDYFGTFDLNALIFDLNGSLVDGKDSFQITTKYFGGTFTYIDSTIGWAFISESNSRPPTRNQIIDGDFNFWYEGVSQTPSGYGSDTMWYNQHTISTKVHTREPFTLGQTLVPGGPKFFSRTVVSSVAGASANVIKRHRIEDVTKLAGGSVTLSLYVDVDAPKDIAVELVQVFGSGGSPSPVVPGIGGQTIACTPGFKKYSVTIEVPSVSGKVLGTDGNHYLSVDIWFDAGSNFDDRTGNLGQESGTYDIARVRLVEGSIDGDDINEDYGETLQKVNRYYEISDEVSANLSGNFGAESTGAFAAERSVYVPFITEKRSIPIVSVGTEPVGGSPGRKEKRGFVVTQSSVPTNSLNFISYWVADARL